MSIDVQNKSLYYTVTMSNYPLINALVAKEEEFDKILQQYSDNYYNFLNAKAAGRGDAKAIGRKMENEVSAMKVVMSDMNGILEQAFNAGLENQDHSATASAALSDQSILVERRMKQYEEARDQLMRLAGEQDIALRDANKSRLHYYAYFIFALALIVSIAYLFMGGSLPIALLFGLLVIGFFLTWEIYKSWLSGFGDLAYSGARDIKGVFRLMT